MSPLNPDETPVSSTPLEQPNLPQQQLNELYKHFDRRWGLDDPRQKLRERADIEATLQAANSLNQFCTGIVSLDSSIRDLSVLVNSKLALNRAQHETRMKCDDTNGAARIFDDIIAAATKEVQSLSGARAAAADFCRWFTERNVENLQTETLQDGGVEAIELLSILKKNISGFARVYGMLAHSIEEFPERWRAVGQSTRYSVDRIEKRFSADADEQGTSSLLDYLDPVKQLTPTYANNPLLTCFLYQTLRAISFYLPATVTKGSGLLEVRKPKIVAGEFVPKPEFRALELYVRNHADNKLLPAIKRGGRFAAETRQVLSGLYSVYDELKKLVVKLNLTSVIRAYEAGGQVSTAEDAYVLSFKKGFEGKKAATKEFSPEDLFASVTCFARERRSATKVGPTMASQQDQRILELFGELEKFIRELSKSHLSTPSLALYEKLAEFSVRFKTLSGIDDAALSRDNREGNICYSAVKRDGTLILEQALTPRVEYSDLIGASWKTVLNDVRAAMDYKDLSRVYGSLTPRRRVNANTLLLGPYGCGKNHFVRALMSDPRVIGVNMSTDRLLTKWFGEAEANIRRLFEAAHRIRRAQDKPVIIAWDEIDSLFASDVHDGTLSRVQKAFQSVLDGDTRYDGVTVIGMSNRPDKIPVPIYRRFASVRVIEALTSEERSELLKKLLSSLPLSPRLIADFNWGAFGSNTEGLSGDGIGKIFDKLYSAYIARLEQSAGREALLAIDAAARAEEERSGKITPVQGSAIFRAHGGPEAEITLMDLSRAVQDVLADADIKGAMQQQKMFYSAVHKKLASAFQGDL